jgi:hypothetical protein
MSLFSNEDILTKEIESWKGFEYVLRKENRILFNKMLSRCAESEGLLKAVNAKGVQFSAESLFMILIFQQQKMISQLIAKLSEYKKLQM